MPITRAIICHPATKEILDIVAGKQSGALVEYTLSEKLSKVDSEAVKSFISDMLIKLYDGDQTSFLRDITKINMLQKSDICIEPSEREHLLRIYLWLIKSCFKDYPQLLEELLKNKDFLKR